MNNETRTDPEKVQLYRIRFFSTSVLLTWHVSIVSPSSPPTHSSAFRRVLLWWHSTSLAFRSREGHSSIPKRWPSHYHALTIWTRDTADLTRRRRSHGSGATATDTFAADLVAASNVLLEGTWSCSSVLLDASSTRLVKDILSKWGRKGQVARNDANHEELMSRCAALVTLSDSRELH